jgi:hypothetical protein
MRPPNTNTSRVNASGIFSSDSQVNANRSASQDIPARSRNAPKSFGSIDRPPLHEPGIDVKIANLEAKLDALAAATALGHSDLLVGQTTLGRQLLAVTELLNATVGARHRDDAMAQPQNERTALTPDKTNSQSTKQVHPQTFLDEDLDEEEEAESDDDRDDISAINKFKLVDKDGSGTLDLAEVYNICF